MLIKIVQKEENESKKALSDDVCLWYTAGHKYTCA